ncbi:MAG: hypothetical protein Q8K87_06330 [Hydrogenophaga sp.]|nr:hypothetical protein [Hydrogenophaga sp.]MDP1893737.1 hypothetical protein [Hydrogenophaga sp.]
MLNLPDPVLRDFFRQHHVRRLSLFGMVRMQAQLSAMLGQTVDLRTAGDLSRYFRQEVIESAQVQYAA